jgi:predicted Zn finger-like uncharacterized protein
MFRVVPDQLRISEGWVRCGQCDEVFDANAHLRSLEALAGVPPSAPVLPEQADPEPAFQVPATASAAYEATLLAPMQVEPEPAYDWGPVVPEAEAASQEPPAGPLMPVTRVFEREGDGEVQAYSLSSDPWLEQGPQGLPLAPAPAGAEGESVPADGWEPTELASLEVHDPAAQARAVSLPDVPADDPLPSFMAPAAGASGPGRWPGRRSLLTASGFLVLVLALQVLMQERDRIAAVSAALRPLLMAGCEVLACKVSPLQEIDAIAIDSSAFTSVRPGLFLLQLSLKNTAPSDRATPALELTLTDTQDRPLLRRVLQPAELSNQSFMAGGSELAAKLPISVKPGVVPEKIAGYKLLAFYP